MSEKDKGGSTMNFKKIGYIALLTLIILVFGYIVIFVPKFEKKAKVKQDSRFGINDVTARTSAHGTISTEQTEQNKENTISIVSTNFASYDFVRAIAKDKAEIKFILGAGKDTHSYEPTASDIVTIGEADLFIYIGGEMEKWANKIVESQDFKNVKMFCIADYVDTMEEQEVDGAEEEEEEEEVEGAFDEHIWTSPTNAIKMVEAIRDMLMEYDANNADFYVQNADEYIKKIEKVREDIKQVTDQKVRNRLVFGDKMPMQYFLKEYGLTASAAFNGCSTETEPSAATIAYLVDKVKEEQIPVVLYIELNTGKVANMIASEAGNGTVAMQIQTLHNVTKDDFENGETYVSLMERNIDVLKKALQ